ncbi:PEBP-like protein [Hesseltinella vesiculosa]|uniref:PEBP-like protein n=1 Tax=Hesseltinella vesiculosa TaxID=101127 RepID=A0A1X2G7Y6_9FUNG|nr:PEBP-like protein [Hesseltinella vesiculosa]
MLVMMDTAMSHALQTSGVIPDVVSPQFKNQGILTVNYGEEQVAIGNHLSVEQTAEAPKVMYVSGEESTHDYYTLMLVDPDAPSRADPKNGPWRHWVVTNIPEGQPDQVNASANQLTTYIGPSPPAGSGDHRYVFLWYKQLQGIQTFAPLSQSVHDRRSFNYSRYAQEQQLELLAVNFFFACKE